MPETTIGVNHRAHFLRLNTLTEHWVAERARLQAELNYVMQQGAKIEGEMLNLLKGSYHIDARTMPVTVDTDRGVIITPDLEPVTPTEPVPAKEAGPAPTEAKPVLKLAKAKG
jgi:hypothetical protein